MNLQDLAKPFPEKDVKWVIMSTNMAQVRKKDPNAKYPTYARYAPYITNRAVMNRLDEVVGIGKWKNEFKPMPIGKGILCGISILIDGEWVTKWDGADESDIETEKGSLSNAMKRAAVQWGIGRYLYDYRITNVEVEQKYGSPPKTPLKLPEDLLPGFNVNLPTDQKGITDFGFLVSQGADIKLDMPDLPDEFAGKTLTEVATTSGRVAYLVLQWLAGEIHNKSGEFFVPQDEKQKALADLAKEFLKYR